MKTWGAMRLRRCGSPQNGLRQLGIGKGSFSIWWAVRRRPGGAHPRETWQVLTMGKRKLQIWLRQWSLPRLGCQGLQVRTQALFRFAKVFHLYSLKYKLRRK